MVKGIMFIIYWAFRMFTPYFMHIPQQDVNRETEAQKR